MTLKLIEETAQEIPTRYYVDEEGCYLGGFGGGAEPPTGAIEVPEAPQDARQIWNFGIQAWGPIPPTVPESVTVAQAKVALIRRGLMPQVKTTVATYPEDIQEWYASAREWQRYNPYVMGIAIELSLTDNEVDELFTYASTLSA